MTLATSISNSLTCKQLCQIFEKNVRVDIDTMWGTDSVSVNGYEDAVSTNFIASHVINNLWDVDESQKDSAQTLQNLLENKVFCPLRDRFLQLERDNRFAALVYKIRNLTRICYTPDNPKLTAGYTCLKHSVCTMFI